MALAMCDAVASATASTIGRSYARADLRGVRIGDRVRCRGFCQRRFKKRETQHHPPGRNLLLPANTNMLKVMEESGLSVWVSTSDYGYYLMLAFHALGLAVLVGTASVVNLRILGFFRELPYQSLRTLLKLGLAGFVINVLSGAALFMSQAGKFYYMNSFRVKISLIVLGMTSLVVFRGRVLSQANHWQSGRAPAGARAMAVGCLGIWLGVITAGRLMAYL